MIKTLVESGRTLEAQKMILDVVESQYKGTAQTIAQTTSGQIKGAFMEFGDAMEEFGRIIAEALVPFLNKLTEIIRQIGSLDDSTKKLILVMGGLVAVVGPAMLAIGMLTKGLIAMGVAFTTATGPIGMMITAIGLLTGAYIIHKTKISEAESVTKSFVTLNTEFAKALVSNATEMANFANSAERTADQIKAVNEAFKQMVSEASSRAKTLEESLEGARRELLILESSPGRGNILGGYGKDSERANELREQIKSLTESLKPLYGFLVKAGEGMDSFATSTKKASTDVADGLLEGSISKLRKELQALNEQFENTASGVERADLAKKINDVEYSIGQLRSVLTPATAELKLLKEEMARDDGFSSVDWDSQYQGVRIVTAEMRFLEAATLVTRSVAISFTDSFGAGLANVIVQGERLTDVLKNIGKLLLSSAIQQGLRLLFLGTTGFGVAGGTTGIIGSIFAGAAASPIAGSALSMDGAFKLQGTDLVLAINRSERTFR
jgi:predicted  nucleic acid-binding Zn-ribbon protein